MISVFYKVKLYSRGKSHLIRLAVAVHLLLTFWNSYERSAITRHSVNDACNPGPSGIDTTHSDPGNGEESNMEEDVKEDDSDTGSATTDRQAIEIASSLVKTCLSQLCKCLHDYKTLCNNANNQTIYVQRKDFNLMKLY